MITQVCFLILLSASAFYHTHAADTEVSAEGVFVKIQGQSGGMTIGKAKNPDQDNNAVKIKFDAIQEKDSSGNIVGASGNAKHSFNNFAQLDFVFSSLRDTEYENLTAKAINFTASISSVNAKMRVETFLFTESGNITVDGESTMVEKGSVKFNIKLEDWTFCDNSGNCKKGQATEIGEYVDLTISIKGKSTPSRKTGNNKRTDGEEYALGGDASVALSKKISKDGGSPENMPGNYPAFETQGSKQLFVFRFPKFTNNVLYDPIIYSGVADTSSGAAYISLGFPLLFMALFGVFLSCKSVF
ncbi:skeletal aspartic acid-rich protein 1-like [Saccostrea echinata]|uniref:skeletal aspartic acid-rich protein 1-like n=1 Tax=Saccostrea echinata TaxID=191078 RepID=UPI002A81C043|nr:skeletal aspartic acid-rich protein 1-like [Saccostrea echinata]